MLTEQSKEKVRELVEGATDGRQQISFAKVPYIAYPLDPSPSRLHTIAQMPTAGTMVLR